MKLTKKETQHFTGLVEALRAAELSINDELDKLRTELETWDDEDGERYREDLSWFVDEKLGFLDYKVDAIREWRTELEALEVEVAPDDKVW